MLVCVCVCVCVCFFVSVLIFFLYYYISNKAFFSISLNFYAIRLMDIYVSSHGICVCVPVTVGPGFGLFCSVCGYFVIFATTS